MPWTKRPIQIKTHSFIFFFWCYFCIIFGVYILQIPLEWPIVRFTGNKASVHFLDTQQTIDQLICRKEAAMKGDLPLREECGFVYGNFLVKIIPLSLLKTNLTILLGLTFILMFAAVYAHFLASVSEEVPLLQKFIYLLIVFSPPNMLLLERGNFEVLMFALLFGIALALYRRRFFSSFLLVTIASLIKFYPIALFFLVFVNHRRFFIKALTIFGSTLTCVVVFKDILSNSIEFPKPTSGMFGNLALSNYLRMLGLNVDQSTGYLIGIIFLLALAYAFFKSELELFRLMSRRITYLNTQTKIVALYKVFLLAFVSCYFAASNIDYRLYLLQLAGICAIALFSNSEKNRGLLLGSLLIISWTSAISGFTQFIGDCFILFWLVMLLRTALPWLLEDICWGFRASRVKFDNHEM